MTKVFISYSTKNKELAEAFHEFLQLGMGVNKDNIFCTVSTETLVTGEAFIETIRKELKDCEAVISLVTEEYLRSEFCLVEMGAAWAMSKRYFPLLLVPFERLNITPLHGVQMRKLNDSSDISMVYDELFECGVRKRSQTAEFNKRLPIFIETINKLHLHNENDLLKKDEDGYYEAIISQVRKVKENYRCYGIKGRIADICDDESSDSDWIFFFKGAFSDLCVGDKVRFKIMKSEVRTYSDLGRARNLYPLDLKKVEN